MASSRVIGLDIGSSAVRAAELEFGGGARSGKSAPTLVRVGEVALPLGAVRDGEVVQPTTVSQALRQLWSRAKFESKDVIIGVGNQRVLVRDLDLPAMPLAQLKSSLPFQVGDMLPMSADEALLDYYPIGEVDGPQGRMVRGMLVAAQRDTVTSNVLAVEGAGLRPVMVDLNGFALLRALARGEFAEPTTAFVDVGATITTVVIAAGGVPRLVRSLPSGGQHVTAAVASALNVAVPEAENLKREIGVGFSVPPDRQPAAEAIGAVVRTLVESVRNTFVYYQSNSPGATIDVLVLTGGGAHLPGLGQYMSSATRLPATLGNPIATLRQGKSAARDVPPGRESLLALSIGLAYGVAA
ncbi:MAG: type IV pilus assembly protein PilM [Cellulomonas sp.]|uniref:type IV pilus assembly protein PilM n=1 Tax=Cellulomonas sp. 73-92 TaxID=1895740 RepID=UPI00092B7CE7|nr:type IV pilus assembly protein PilM [Cellulomonas sp. 73-92]MBN9374654.1 type IV pilus assembly protein PilM [Cellulomonas sp.]OJV80286.1 MAG: pilus assembly protein PilM [Cellulomonas sp. 73-92]